MKKIIALTLALMATSALAAENLANRTGVFGGVDYNYLSGVGKNSDESANGYGLTLGGSPLKWLDLELRNEFSMINLGGDSSFLDFSGYTASNNQLEGAATAYYGINNVFGVYGRAAVGQNWADNLTDFTYGSIEPGVYFTPKGQRDNSKINLGYRYRGSFDNDVAYNTNSVVLGGEYAFNDRDSIIGRYEYVDGDQEFNVFRIGYLAHF